MSGGEKDGPQNWEEKPKMNMILHCDIKLYSKPEGLIHTTEIDPQQKLNTKTDDKRGKEGRERHSPNAGF